MKKLLLLALSLNIFAISATAQQFLDKTLVHDNETREYRVYLPASYTGNEPFPVMFNFHGGSGDIASQVFTSDMRPIADTANFIVVYPQALPDPNAAGSTLWTHKAPTDVDDVFFVEAMIDALADDYSIDENRVYACGYSNGGEFTFELACRLGDRIAAIGVVARSMFIETFDACMPSHPTGVVTIHGTGDDYDGIAWAGTTYYVSLEEVNEFWSNFNNTDATPVISQVPNTNTSDGSTVEHHVWQNGNECVSVEHFKVINGGHDWPGSFGNMDIDASLEIWNFVSKYNRTGLIGCSTSSTDESTNARKEIRVFPNPTSGEVRLEGDFLKNQKYRVYSSVGALVLEGEVEGDVIDFSSFGSGVYFFRIGGEVVKVWVFE